MSWNKEFIARLDKSIESLREITCRNASQVLMSAINELLTMADLIVEEALFASMLNNSGDGNAFGYEVFVRKEFTREFHRLENVTYVESDSASGVATVQVSGEPYLLDKKRHRIVSVRNGSVRIEWPLSIRSEGCIRSEDCIPRILQLDNLKKEDLPAFAVASELFGIADKLDGAGSGLKELAVNLKAVLSKLEKSG